MDKIIETHLKNIRNTASCLARKVTLMEICGGHTNVIMKYGIRDLLPKNIRLISGPGCPVCVSSQKDIDSVIALSLDDVAIATYGDMMRVPGSRISLEQAKAKGAKVFEVYSATEVLKLKEQYPEIVFFGIGFETTAPMTAFLLANRIRVYSSHKLVPPAMKALILGKVRIDGFIDPGHVSTIIGERAYDDIKVPQVIAGFSAERVLRAISLLLELIKADKKRVLNAYPEAVGVGNKKAQQMLAENFIVSDSEWRGLGMIPDSGLEVRDKGLDAKEVHKKLLSSVETHENKGCRCADILKGMIEPDQCPLYKEVCTPQNPQGACMVSEEGSCAIYYRYGR